MTPIIERLVLLIMVGSAATVAIGEELQRNPFAVPPEFSTQNTASPGARSFSAKPVIRGILQAGERSLVNLNGTVIGVGETAGGYQLIAVSDGVAVFLHGDETIRVNLYDDADTD